MLTIHERTYRCGVFSMKEMFLPSFSSLKFMSLKGKHAFWQLCFEQRSWRHARMGSRGREGAVSLFCKLNIVYYPTYFLYFCIFFLTLSMLNFFLSAQLHRSTKWGVSRESQPNISIVLKITRPFEFNDPKQHIVYKITQNLHLTVWIFFTVTYPGYRKTVL